MTAIGSGCPAWLPPTWAGFLPRVSDLVEPQHWPLTEIQNDRTSYEARLTCALSFPLLRLAHNSGELQKGKWLLEVQNVIIQAARIRKDPVAVA